MRSGTEPTVATGHSEEGSASVEFVMLSALLLIPVIYFLMLTSQIQAASYAAVAAADQAAQAMVTAPDAASAGGRMEAVIALTLGDYGLDPSVARSTVTCSAATCLEPGSSVAVEVAIRVPVPLIPQGLGWDTSAATVTSSSQHPVPRFG